MGETQGLINQSMEQFPLDESQANGPEDEDYKEDDDDEDEESDEAESDDLTELSTSELLQTMSEGEVDSQIQEINTMELLERYEGRRRGNALRDHLMDRVQINRQGLNIDQLLNYPSNET